VRAFMRHVEVSPWEWTPAMADEWFADMRGVRHLARSTLRGHQGAIRGFCSFITDPAYGWAQVCEEQFGAHPIQVLNEVNSAAHVADSEADAAKRAFSRDEARVIAGTACLPLLGRRGDRLLDEDAPTPAAVPRHRAERGNLDVR
jgi:integrase/recombinase XerC